MTMIAMEFFEGVATRDECFALINRYSPQMQTYEGGMVDNPHHALGLKAGQFFEINPEEYWYFLEVLPPLAMTSAGFAMSEFTIGNLTNAFLIIGKHFYCMTIAIECDGPDAAINRAGRALQEAQSGRVIPTPAFLNWAGYLALCEATPKPDVSEMISAAEAAIALMEQPEGETQCGLFKPGAIAFYERGKPWRFSHKGARKEPAAVWYFGPKGGEQERRDAVRVAMSAAATVGAA